ncbi:non-ribosomal peptide synthase [Allostella vacuolata]|nr:non-ribosomal peptide synthase [Stella vacuolata]
MDGSISGETYREQGYCAPIPVLPAAEAHRYRACLEASEAAIGRPLTREERTKPHILFGWAAELARHPAILRQVEPLVGPDILCWETVLFTKEPGGQEFISWHQDLTYWGLEPGDQVVTAWLALSPSTVESGCMRVVPGSHRRDLAPHRDTYDPDNLLSRGQEIAVEVQEGEWADIVLSPGEMSLHHVRIVHGSDRNRSNDRRIGFAARYFSTAVRQKSPSRDSAFLVQGQDRFGHFDLEPAPAADYSEAARDLHAEFRRRRRALQAAL